MDPLLPLKVLNWIVKNGYEEAFPNIYIAYRLLLTIPIASCKVERSFNVLKRIKNGLKSEILHLRLSALALLNTESDVFLIIDFEDIIMNFAATKKRQRPL